ncbi:sulfotransferase family cytosolic 1B member 1-like [Pecten maximus]|uniref:sulfotransferase family cytosolic 1B member 1-like n=1 Tax=Pecten maximus TaxID=6579 RepID=UPI0014581F8C|nr:sulfotransferase family cytosolic 1B member 1-like [Pecten maximus]XP_033751444.1 sulfotransferase family cytosolic 1B member 1-like [Pecten maximus]
MDILKVDPEEREKMLNAWRIQKHPIYDGCMFPKFPVIMANPEKHMEALRNLDSRESDILLCTFPKAGTHWVHEIVSMILQEGAQYTSGHKGGVMLEAMNLEELNNRPSPRFLNTHVAFRHIPKKHIDNGYKIIHVSRNPKDVMVSFYNHTKNDPTTTCTEEDFPGSWNDYIQDMCANKHNFYGGFVNYEREWEEAKRTKAVTNIHSAFYEDLKKNPAGEIERLAAFLNKELSPQLIQDIADKCSFKNLADATTSGKKGEDMISKVSKDKTNFIFRKGTTGDWKNWFTVAQNEMFDLMLEKELKDTDLKFTYEL